MSPDGAAPSGGSRPAVVVVCGLPGSGKSTLARALAGDLGAVRISSDEVRAETGRLGDYRAEAIDAVYRLMLERAGGVLDAGRTALLDATFSSSRFRGWALELARGRGAAWAVVRVRADEATTLARLARRRDASEASPATYALLKDRFDPVEGAHLSVDTGTLAPEAARVQALTYVREALAGASPR